MMMKNYDQSFEVNQNANWSYITILIKFKY